MRKLMRKLVYRLTFYYCRYLLWSVKHEFAYDLKRIKTEDDLKRIREKYLDKKSVLSHVFGALGKPYEKIDNEIEADARSRKATA